MMIELALIASSIIIINILTWLTTQTLFIMILTLMIITLTINYVILSRTPSEYVNYYTPLFWTTSSHLLIKYLGLNEFLQDLSLILLFFTLILLFWDTPVLRGLFTYATPPLILLSVFISNFTGCTTPVRFVILALIDSLTGRSLATVIDDELKIMFLQAIFTAALGISPIFFVSSVFLTYNIIASMAKVILYLKNFKKIDYIAIDMVLKITIPGVFA